MKLTFSKRSGYLAAGCLAGFTASMAFTQTLSVFAGFRPHSYDDLREMQAIIGECRQVIPVNGSTEVFDSTELTKKPENRIGTINVGTPVKLTGVIREVEGTAEDFTAVQIYMIDRRFPKQQPVGWVDASKITDTIPCP